MNIMITIPFSKFLAPPPVPLFIPCVCVCVMLICSVELEEDTDEGDNDDNDDDDDEDSEEVPLSQNELSALVSELAAMRPDPNSPNQWTLISLVMAISLSLLPFAHLMHQSSSEGSIDHRSSLFLCTGQGWEDVQSGRF